MKIDWLQRGACGALVCLWACLGTIPRASGAMPADRSTLHGGREIYQAACAACHGSIGEGTPQSQAGFEQPDTFPHFNKCDETTPEYTRDWKAAILKGGPGRGFSPIMPAFGGVLTPKQVDEVIVYLRSLCPEKDWPVGELNVPRAILTEKAFPESESILLSAVNATGKSGASNEFDYEKILDKRDQLEVAVPFSWAGQPGGGTTAGIGDVALGIKHVLFSQLDDPRGSSDVTTDRTGEILSLQTEIILPTGSKRDGFGTGETTFAAFAAYDQLLPAQTFLELQGGADLPIHSGRAPRSVFFRTAFGRSFAGDHELGRLWTPMLEVVSNRDLVSGAKTDFDVVPEFQVTLNRRQHIRAALGYRIPVNDTAGRPQQVELYFLWDWFDGGLLEGW
jgi:mono/diheme cytochrome c family protein